MTSVRYEVKYGPVKNGVSLQVAIKWQRLKKYGGLRISSNLKGMSLLKKQTKTLKSNTENQGENKHR